MDQVAGRAGGNVFTLLARFRAWLEWLDDDDPVDMPRYEAEEADGDQ